MSTKTIRIMCPNLMCRRVLSVPGEARGRTVRCRGCGSSIRIPTIAKAGPAPKPTPQPPVSETDVDVETT